jgi:hypothetical protein
VSRRIPVLTLQRYSAFFAGGLLVSALAMPANGEPIGSQGTSGGAATARICSGCHSLQIVMDTPKDFDAWHDTVQKMIDHGAQGTPEEFEAVMQFLFSNVTTIDVNHGDADELTTVLHASQPDAEAIMARRSKRPFKDLAELESAVPGLDKSLLDKKKKLIFFQ